MRAERIEPVCRVVQRDDYEQLLHLLGRIRPALGGFSSSSLYSALIESALRDPLVTICVARIDDSLVGYTIAIVDWDRFWRRFAFRHPIVAVRVALRKYLKRRRRRPRHPGGNAEQLIQGQHAASGESIASWSDSSRRIAKILHTGVDQSVRSRGVGAALHRAVFAELSAVGVERLDARFDRENVASIRLHYKTGWSVRDDPDGLFATIDLRAG